MGLRDWWNTRIDQLAEVKAEAMLEKRRLQIQHKRRLIISDEALKDSRGSADVPIFQIFPPTPPGIPSRPRVDIQAYEPPKGVCDRKHVLAMDSAMSDMYSQAMVYFSGLGFPGFPYLTELTQIAEYRDMSERIAAEMVRKGWKLRSKSKKDQSVKIKELTDAMEDHHVKDHMRRCAVLDGQMGRAQLFINLGDEEGPELETELMLTSYKVKKGSLKGYKVIEPITTYPAAYNASNPLKMDYYTPSAWFVYGQKVSASRLLMFNSRPLPDLLKPVYNFSGMSMSQLGQPYVDYWLNTRNSVGNLLRNFSTTVFHTDLTQTLGPDGAGIGNLIKRVQLFNNLRDNQGVFVANSSADNKEEMTQINTPLSGLDKLEAQAQEHLGAVSHTPMVVLTGITPSGLNASSEGELRAYYDYVADQQEVMLREPLTIIIKIEQLNLYGFIDPDITFEFEPLYSLTGKELALIRKSDAEAGVALITAGVIDPAEERDRLANDPQSGYDNLDVDKVPPPPSEADLEKLKGKSTASSGAESGAEQGAEEGSLRDAVTPVLDALEDAVDKASFVMRSSRLAHDGAMDTAFQATVIAQSASEVSRIAETHQAHNRAAEDHSDALRAHQEALRTCSDSIREIHESFCGAHQLGIDTHRFLAGMIK